MARKFRELLDEMSPARRARLDEDVAALRAAMPLRALREARHHTQDSLAERLQTSQPGISRLEQRGDVYVSTLRRYIESMGGELELVARFPDGAIRITQFES